MTVVLAMSDRRPSCSRSLLSLSRCSTKMINSLSLVMLLMFLISDVHSSTITLALPNFAVSISIISLLSARFTLSRRYLHFWGTLSFSKAPISTSVLPSTATIVSKSLLKTANSLLFPEKTGGFTFNFRKVALSLPVVPCPDSFLSCTATCLTTFSNFARICLIVILSLLQSNNSLSSCTTSAVLTCGTRESKSDPSLTKLSNCF